MRFDIEEGNLCDALLEKIGVEDSKKVNSSPSPSTASPFASGLTNNDLDLLNKLHILSTTFLLPRQKRTS